MHKNQWYDEIAKEVTEYNLSENEINRIAADYEFMAEAGRLADNFGINYLSVGSTPITEDAEQQFVHGSISGDPKFVAEAIAVAMYRNPDIAEVIKNALMNYHCFVKARKN